MPHNTQAPPFGAESVPYQMPYMNGLYYQNGSAPVAPNPSFPSYVDGGVASQVYSGYPSMLGMPGGSVGVNNGGLGPVFKKRSERIDWRKIAALDVERVQREMDVQTLQDNLMNITFCNLESEVDCRNMDPNFTKLFKVAQLSIEYMLYSQEYLANVMAGLENRLSQVVLDHEATKKQMEKQKQELIQVKKESHKRKKLLAAQQQILHSGAQAYHKCPFCPKAFVHESYCVSHIQRRHADQAGSQAIIQETPKSPPQSDRASYLERELIEVKERLRVTEIHLKEKESKVAFDDQHMEAWKAKERDRQHEEFESIRQMFLDQFEDLNHKYMESERQLMKLRGKSLTNTNVDSNLGDLADDTDTETERSRALRSSNIRNVLSPDKSLKDQMDTQTFTIEKRNQQEIARLDAVLKSSRPALSPPASQPNTPKSKASDVIPLNDGAGASGAVVEEVVTSQVAATAASAVGNEPWDVPLISEPGELTQSAPASSIAQKRSFSPESPVRSPRSGSPAKKSKDRFSPGERPVYDQSDDDVYDDEESELREVKQEFTMWTQEEAMNGALSQSSLNSSGPQDERVMATDESLISAVLRCSRLNKQLTKDPGMLKSLIEELNNVLDEQLEEKGITKDLNGISNVVLNDKLESMQKDREIMERKYSNFRKIRRQYERKVDREGRQKWEEMEKEMPTKESKSIAKKMSNTLKKIGSSFSSSLPNLSSKSKSNPPSRSPSRERSKSPTKPPKKPVEKVPASPRSPAVIKKDTTAPAHAEPLAPPRFSTTISTEYSSAQETRDESDDDDDEDETTSELTEDQDGLEDFDEVDSPPAKRVGAPPSPKPKIIMSGPPPEPDEEDSDSPLSRLVALGESSKQPRVIMSGPAPSTSGGPPPPPPRSPDDRVSSKQDEISDWDSTEVSDMKPTVRANVRDITKSLDSQLQQRGQQKPFGGVNTVPHNNNSKKLVPDDVDDEDEDDDLSISVSSLNDAPPKPVPRRRPVRGSADTEFSTNTGGTSVWESVSKVPEAPHPGVGKSSQSLTDWDSDLDLDDIG